MELVVFSGPTLAPARIAEALPGACCLGPVQRGDVFRILRHEPRRICILDGLFGGVLPVWHKEILWALKRGVRVFGASSMGALRAAELARFGMLGVGRIFEAYQREELENEDEVTVVHAGPERDYRASSEALVDIRATLDAALVQGVIDAAQRGQLVELASCMFYAERSYPALLVEAERAGLGSGLPALARFLGNPSNHVSLKRNDALECLDVLRRELAGSRHLGRAAASANLPDFEFSYTDAFDAFVSEESAGEASAAAANAAPDEIGSDLLLEELQLLGPEVFEPLLRQATARALRVVVARAQGSVPEATLDVDLVRESSAHGVQELQRLLAELDLTPQAYGLWMREEASIRSVEEQTHAVLQAQFAPLLRALGDYPRVAQRARRKLETCGAAPAPIPGADVPGIWRAYFEGALNLDVPDDLDVYAASVGFRDQAQLLAAVVRELDFRRLV